MTATGGAPTHRQQTRAVVEGKHDVHDSDWRWWNHLVLRGGGFSASGVLQLGCPSLAALADQLAAEDSPDAAAWDRFQREFDRQAINTATLLQEIARLPRFREALTWQNPRTYENTVQSMLRWRPGVDGRSHKHRFREELVARYWQRYCVKNEAIGFFGPIGWGLYDPSLPVTHFEPGEHLIDRCEVYFENWTVDRLSTALASNSDMAPWLAPRRVSFLRAEPGWVYLPGEPPFPATVAEVAILRKCDGRLTARQIARELMTEGLDIVDEVAAYEILESLRERHWVVWRLEVPVGSRPQILLRRMLERIEEEALRVEAFSKVDRLEDARIHAAQTSGDPERLSKRLDALDKTFVALTSDKAARNEGQTYAARTIVYMDCHRDVQLTLGADFSKALAPIRLLLDTARWLTYEAGNLVRPALHQVYRDLISRLGPRLNFATFWFECMPVLHGPAIGILDQIQMEFQQRWGRVLQCSSEQALAQYASTELSRDITQLFNAPHSGWDAARYCSPDILVDAATIQDIREDNFQLIVGELHVALNALRHSCLVQQHPDSASLFALLDRDFPEPRLLPMLPKDSPPLLTTRLHSALVRDKDIQVSLLHFTADSSRQAFVLSADLVVEELEGRLVVRVEPDRAFEVMDVFAENLMRLVVDRFRIFADEPHTPRVKIDRLVIAREAWCFDADALDFASEPKEARRFVAARAWAQAWALPRFMFVKTPFELKPFYVDLASPVYVNILSKAVRRAREDSSAVSPCIIRFVEMLPTPDRAWLVDRSGNRYTSELRLVAFDLLRLPGGSWNA